MSAPEAQHFRFIEFHQRRHMRGAEAARVEVDPDGEWLWMSLRDVRANIKLHGQHPELLKALAGYGVTK